MQIKLDRIKRTPYNKDDKFGDSLRCPHGEEKTVTVDANNPTESMLVIEGLSAQDIGKVFTIGVYNGDTLEHEVTYSVNSYIAYQADNDDDATGTLVRSLSRFGNSAIAYAASVAPLA